MLLYLIQASQNRVKGWLLASERTNLGKRSIAQPSAVQYDGDGLFRAHRGRSSANDCSAPGQLCQRGSSAVGYPSAIERSHRCILHSAPPLVVSQATPHPFRLALCECISDCDHWSAAHPSARVRLRCSNPSTHRQRPVRSSASYLQGFHDRSVDR